MTVAGAGTAAQEVTAGRYPVELERDVRIPNGAEIHLRPIRPDDAPKLVAFHSSLSAQSVYLRFFTFHPVLTAREVERFTQVDYADRLAFVVMDGARMVAVGRFDRVARSRRAEVAFVVDDDYQHQGIGTLLADELASAARARGIDEFVADTLPENTSMLEMFRRTGFPVRSSYEDGLVRVRFAIEPVPAYVEALERREARRRPPRRASGSASPPSAGSNARDGRGGAGR